MEINLIPGINKTLGFRKWSDKNPPTLRPSLTPALSSSHQLAVRLHEKIEKWTKTSRDKSVCVFWGAAVTSCEQHMWFYTLSSQHVWSHLVRPGFCCPTLLYVSLLIFSRLLGGNTDDRFLLLYFYFTLLSHFPLLVLLWGVWILHVSLNGRGSNRSPTDQQRKEGKRQNNRFLTFMTH